MSSASISPLRAVTRAGSPGEIAAKRHDTLADALYANVHTSGVPVKQLADALAVHYGTLLDMANPNEQRRFPVQLVAPLTRATACDALIRHLAEACGGVYVALPVVTGGQHVELSRSLGELAREFSDVCEHTGRALADGRLTADEASNLRRQVLDVVAASIQMLCRIDGGAR